MWHVPTSIPPGWGAWVVFASVFLTQMGVPFPAAPMLILAGTMAAMGEATLWPMYAAAVVAAVTADTLWFAAGRRHGRRILNSVVRYSLSLDATLRIARGAFDRFGAPLLAISKFVPGMGFLSPPLMGTTTVRWRVFWVWDALGAGLWAGVYMLGGAALREEVTQLLRFARDNGWTVVGVGLAIAVVLVLYRWLRRVWFRRWLAKVRIEAADLDLLIHSAAPPLIFDARPLSVRRKEAYRIPGALPLDLQSPAQLDPLLLDNDRPIVVYCVCPNEATAKQIIRQLHRKGIHKVQALRGGLDEWERRGFPVEPIPIPE